MQQFSVMALFCEDIREEKGGIYTLIGLMPDNIELAEPLASETGGVVTRDIKMLGKLCVYVRMNFDPEFEIGAPEIRLALPDGSVQQLGVFAADIVAKARENAKAKNNPLAGVISRVSMNNFALSKIGVMRLEVVINNEVHVAAALNLRNAPTASKQPSEQSPSVSS